MDLGKLLLKKIVDVAKDYIDSKNNTTPAQQARPAQRPASPIEEREKTDAVVKKAYRIKVRLTVKGDDEKEQVHFYIYSVKLKGGKWVLYPDDKTMGTLSEKSKDIVKDMDKELSEIFSDYSRSLDFVMPE